VTRHPIEHAAAQTRAQRTRRVVRVELVVNYLADRGMFAEELPPAGGAGLRHRLVLIALVSGVDVHGHERKLNGRALPQHIQDLYQRPAVFPAGQADHDAVAVFNQIEVDDRLRGFLRDARLERGAVRHFLNPDYTDYTD
jgi:hypothetical protein